jgi:hypothetical protein
MGRKAASPPIDRNVADTRGRRGNSRQARPQVAPSRLRVADAAKIRHRGRHPPKQSHLTAIEVNETCLQVIDDFSHPIPVPERELDAIEMYIGQLIDMMLEDRD